MSPYYNLTAVSNTTGLLPFVQGVNTEMGLGWLGSLFLIGLTVLFFIGFYYSTGNTGKSLGASMFLGFLFCVMLRALDLVPNLALYISLLGAALGVAFIWKNTD